MTNSSALAPRSPQSHDNHPPLRLLTDQPVRPTPAGAYRAVARPTPDPVGSLLLATMRGRVTPRLSLDAVRTWASTTDDQTALAVLRAAQDDGLIEAIDETLALADGRLEELVPPYLATLSDEGRALLADPDGLPVWSAGFEAGFAARLAAMSADLAVLHERHQGAIGELLGSASSAWALVDGLGASRVGCWPIHVGATRFVLVAQGLPRMHHPNFTTLVWLLVHRYG